VETRTTAPLLFLPRPCSIEKENEINLGKEAGPDILYPWKKKKKMVGGGVDAKWPVNEVTTSTLSLSAFNAFPTDNKQ
jgi:hypothetical protein